MAEVIVAGGGPSGLAAAFRLQQAGHAVRVLEAADRAGSKLASGERDGFLVDRGAFFVPSTHTHFLTLGLDAGVTAPVAGGFQFGAVRDGESHALDGNHLARAFAGTGLISGRAKLAAAKLVPEVVRARKATVDRITEAGRYDTETLASWAERTLGPELAGYLIDPMIRAIFAAEADDVSRVELLTILALFAGAKLVAFPRGMAQYADELAAGLDVTLGAEVLAVEQTPDGAEVTWRDAAGAEQAESVDGCVVALPADAAARALPGLGRWRADYLGRVRQGKLVIVHIGLARAPAGVAATYTMIPRAEHEFLGGIVCDHNKAAGRVPPGKGLLTMAFTNPWCEAHFDDDDEALAATALEVAEGFMPGTADGAEFVEVNRWTQQYVPVGHYATMTEFRARSEIDKTVQLAGEYLAATHLSGATASGEAAAQRLAAALP